jgi:crossover junction endodeoxyribonuclease RuvC
MKPSLVLGCDLSYTCAGLVWLSTPGGKAVTQYMRLIREEKIVTKPGPARLMRAAKAFHAAVEGLRPELAVIEGPTVYSFNKEVEWMLVELSAIMKFVLESWSVPYILASPSAIKKYITGNGKAEKQRVADELTRVYGVFFDDDPGHDLSDAAALAVWGLKK